MILFALLVLAAYAVYVMTPQERDRLLQAGLKYAKHARAAALEAHQRQDPFRELLRARTTLAVVAPALAALNVIVFVMMLFGPGAFSDPATLIGWGANFGPRTTNGEWSRLVTALFVHVGVVHLLVNVAGMLQVGLLLERLLGPLAVALVYVAAGAFSSLENVSSHPIGISAGASGAIFGLYGLLIASVMWSFLQRGRPQQARRRSVDRRHPRPGDPRRILVAPGRSTSELADESASNPMAITMSALAARPSRRRVPALHAGRDVNRHGELSGRVPGSPLIGLREQHHRVKRAVRGRGARRGDRHRLVGVHAVARRRQAGDRAH